MSKKELSNKIEKFVKYSFPDYDEYEVLNLSEADTKVLLTYGKDKIKVTIGLDGNTNSLFRILETKFVA